LMCARCTNRAPVSVAHSRRSGEDEIENTGWAFGARLFDCDGTIADSMPLHYVTSTGPRARPCSINSRYASQTLADGGEGALGAPCFSEKGAIKSGVTRMAGFAGARRLHPGRHTTTPADFRYALVVSLRTPVACSMRRKGRPSFPSAMTCCFFSSLKTLLMPKEPMRTPLGVNVPGPTLAVFQLTLHGRILGDP
jgi:hypothetical protein